MANELSPEEKAFFESGGETGLPADYAGDAGKQAEQQATNADQGEQQNAEANAADDKGQNQAENEGEREQGAEPAQANDKDHRVPLAEFMTEKKKRQNIERSLAEMQERYNITEQRMNLMLQAQQQNRPQPQQEQAPQIPNAEEDPIGALKWMQQQAIQQTQREAQYRQQSEQQAREQQVTHQVVNAYRNAATEYAQADPDFSAAHGYLLQQRYQELLASGFDDARARAQVQQDELAMAYEALTQRQNPAERLMALAQARGWARPSKTPTPDLKKIAQGQESNQSLSTAGSSGNGRGKVDAKAIADMAPKEFEAWLAKAGDDGFRAVMGG